MNDDQLAHEDPKRGNEDSPDDDSEPDGDQSGTDGEGHAAGRHLFCHVSQSTSPSPLTGIPSTALPMERASSRGRPRHRAGCLPLDAVFAARTAACGLRHRAFLRSMMAPDKGSLAADPHGASAVEGRGRCYGISPASVTMRTRVSTSSSTVVCHLPVSR